MWKPTLICSRSIYFFSQFLVAVIFSIRKLKINLYVTKGGMACYHIKMNGLNSCRCLLSTSFILFCSSCCVSMHLVCVRVCVCVSMCQYVDARSSLFISFIWLIYTSYAWTACTPSPIIRHSLSQFSNRKK